MPQAKQTGAGGGKKKAAAAPSAPRRAATTAKPRMQQRTNAARAQALGGKTSTPKTANRRKPKAAAKRLEGGGSIKGTSWSNDMGEGVIAAGGMRFDPTRNAKIPVYGGMPQYVGRSPDDPNLPGDQSANLYTARMPNGQQLKGTLGLMSMLLPAFDKVGLRTLGAGGGTFRTFAESDRMHEADPNTAAPGGFSDHNYGRAVDMFFTNPRLAARVTDLLTRLGMQRHGWEQWHFATPDSRYTNGAYRTRTNWDG